MANNEITGTAPLKIGDIVCGGQYRVDFIVQTKGMSRVYKVYDLQLHKYWCLKEVIAKVDDNAPEKEKQRRHLEVEALKYEYALMGMLNIPAIPRALNPQYSKDGNRIWYPMDWVEGASSKRILSVETALPSSTVIKWSGSLIEILGYLHQNNIIYRDMKPENIMISNYGKPTEQVHLIDFGISRVITDTDNMQQKALGTKGYAAPEQKQDNERLDMRWDLYELGATLFHLVTGIHPSKAEKTQGFIGNLDVFKFGTGVSQGLRDVILKATATNIDDRYQTAEEMLVDIHRIGKYDGSYRSKARTKIWGSRLVIASGVVLALLAGSGYYLGSQNVAGQINNQAEVAQSSGGFQDYKKLAQMDPTNIDAYNGMLTALKSKGQVDKKEESEFLGVLTANLSSLKNESGYGDLAYNIGSMYFFYYGDTNDLTGQQEAKTWFNDAIKYNAKNRSLAGSLYVVSDFQGNIQGAMRDGSDVSMYKSTWDAFNTALKGADSANSDDVVTASLYKSTVDLISNYSYKLAQEGIRKDDVVNMINQASNFAAKKDTNESTRVSELKREIVQTAPTLQSKVDISYGIKTK